MLEFALKTFSFCFKLLSSVFVSAVCFVPPVLFDNIYITSMLGPEHYLGLLSVSRTEKQLKPSIRTGSFMLFSFSLQYFPAFPPHTHFYIQILQCHFQEFTFESSSMLP